MLHLLLHYITVHLKDLKWIAKEGVADDAGKIVGEVAVLYGDFLTNVIDFIIVAFVIRVFC